MSATTAASGSTSASLSTGRRAIAHTRCAWRAATAHPTPIAIPKVMMTNTAPWLALAGLGMFHGLNPAMGWLFAAALGMHRKSRRVVWLSLVPIALGHAMSIAIVVAVMVTLGLVIERHVLNPLAGAILLGWALYYAVYGGHRHRVRVGMQTGMLGLGLWSFLMATGHGAGLMLVPMIIPLCLSASPVKDLSASGSLIV